MNKDMILNFSVDAINLLEQDNDCMMVKLRLLHEGVNRNKCDITHDAVLKSLPTIYNKPIIYRLNNSIDPLRSTDVVEHARGTDTTMMQAGQIPESASMEFVQSEGKTFLDTVGVIHKIYNPTLVYILRKRKGNVKVSIEIKITDGERLDNGILVVNEFVFLSVCLLAENCIEGIEGSHMEVTKFSAEDTEFMNKKYEKFSKNNSVIGMINKNIESAKNEVHRNLFLKKEDFGKFPKTYIDKSKDSMSYKKWGEVNKISLMSRVLGSKNYKELVHDVYLIVKDGWENSPSTKLSYPVMCINEDNKLVYNRYGLASALAYAKAGDDKIAVKKAESLYKKLNLKEDSNMSDAIKKNQGLEQEVNPVHGEAKEEILKNKEEELKKKEEILKNKEIELKAKEEGLRAKNSVGKKDEKRLADDIDADEDYWKKKYNALEVEKCALEEKVKKYERAKEVEEMKASLQKCAHIFTAEEKCALEKDIEKCTKSEFEAKLGKAAMDFAVKMNEVNKNNTKDEELEKKMEKEKIMNAYSFGLPVEAFSVSRSHIYDSASKTLDDVFSKLMK